MMKRILSIALLALIAFTVQASQLHAQNANWPTLIVKKWQMKDVTSPALDTMPAEQKVQIKKLMKSMTLEFKADGTCKSGIAGMGESDGTWKLTGDTLVTNEGGAENPKPVIIKELTKTKLVMEAVNGEDTITMIMVPARKKGKTK